MVDEGQTEEVLRLHEKGTEVVERIQVPPSPEEAERLEQNKLDEEARRRSVEPDIDEILEKKKLEDDEWMGGRKPVPYAWFLLIFLGIAALSITSLVMIGRSKSGAAAEAVRAAAEIVEADKQEDRKAAALVEKIEESLTAYLAAESVEEMLPLVREPDRVRPLMDEWYASHPIKARQFEGLGVFQPFTLEGRLFWLITCLVEGEKSETLLVEQTQDGRVLVDWETHVCYQPIPWDDFVVRRPEGKAMDFRIYLQPDPGGFHSHEFRDEDEWVVYRLMAKGSDEYLFGYVPRGSELAGRIDEQVKANRGTPAALYLRLLRPEGTRSPRGVLITEVLSNRWALVEPLNGG